MTKAPSVIEPLESKQSQDEEDKPPSCMERSLKLFVWAIVCVTRLIRWPIEGLMHVLVAVDDRLEIMKWLLKLVVTAMDLLRSAFFIRYEGYHPENREGPVFNPHFPEGSEGIGYEDFTRAVCSRVSLLKPSVVKRLFNQRKNVDGKIDKNHWEEVQGCINTLHVVSGDVRKYYNADDGMAIIGREMNDKEELEREETLIEELKRNNRIDEYNELKEILEEKKIISEQKLEKLKKDQKGE